jgi:RimJ/RimL family protein N-acetyltransferase
MPKVWLPCASAGPAPTSKTWWCILGLNGEVWAALLLHVFKVFQQRREGFVDLKVLEDNLRAQRLYESVGMFVVRREPVPA